MAVAIKSLLNVVVFVVFSIWVLQLLGVVGGITEIHPPALK
jgi:hypothetical protein